MWREGSICIHNRIDDSSHRIIAPLISNQFLFLFATSPQKGFLIKLRSKDVNTPTEIHVLIGLMCVPAGQLDNHCASTLYFLHNILFRFLFFLRALSSFFNEKRAAISLTNSHYSCLMYFHVWQRRCQMENEHLSCAFLRRSAKRVGWRGEEKKDINTRLQYNANKPAYVAIGYIHKMEPVNHYRTLTFQKVKEEKKQEQQQWKVD